MTGRYQILQKKLKELEAELRFVVSYIPPGENDSNAQYLSQEIQRRFLFVNNLIAAEIASQFPSQPRRLRRMAKAFSHLESMFHEWEDHRRNGDAHGDLDNNFGDAVSICSCDDDSCAEPEDDEEEAYDYSNSSKQPEMGSSSVNIEVEDNLNSPEKLVDVNVEQDKPLEKTAGGADKQEAMTVSLKQKRKRNGGGYCGGLITGMIFGTLLMGSIMLRICGRGYLTVEETFLFPT